MASGKYVTFLDSDDYVEPDYMRKIIENITSTLLFNCGTMLSKHLRNCFAVLYTGTIIESTICEF